MRLFSTRLPLLLQPLFLFLAAGGCYRSTRAPVEGGAAPTGPAGPAPHLVVEQSTFETSRLPAVSADGAAVLIGIQDHDGGRGNPNYRFELRDRRDAILTKHSVLTVDEAESMYDAAGPSPKLTERVAAANRWLAEQHAARRFVPLARLEVEPGEEIASSVRATGGGVTVEWRESRLSITQSGRPILERTTPQAWLAKDRPRPADLGPCHNPAFLSAAAVSVEHKVALIVVGYGGTDTCWEPEAQHHVVAW